MEQTAYQRRLEENRSGGWKTKQYSYKGQLYKIGEILQHPDFIATGVRPTALRSRLTRMTVADALQDLRPVFEYQGRSMSREEACALPEVVERGVTPKIFSSRLSNGWTITRALTEPVNEKGKVNARQRAAHDRAMWRVFPGSTPHNPTKRGEVN